MISNLCRHGDFSKISYTWLDSLKCVKGQNSFAQNAAGGLSSLQQATTSISFKSGLFWWQNARDVGYQVWTEWLWEVCCRLQIVVFIHGFGTYGSCLIALYHVIREWIFSWVSYGYWRIKLWSGNCISWRIWTVWRSPTRRNSTSFNIRDCSVNPSDVTIPINNGVKFLDWVRLSFIVVNYFSNFDNVVIAELCVKWCVRYFRSVVLSDV